MSLLIAPVGALLFPSPVPLAPAGGAPAAAPLACALALAAFAAVGRARHTGHRRGAAQRAVQQRDAVQVAADRRDRRCRCSARLGGRGLGRRGRSRGPGAALATRLGTSARRQRRGWSGGRRLCSRGAGGRRRGGTIAAACRPDARSTAAHGEGGGRSARGRRRVLGACARWQGRGRRVSCWPWRRASARPLAPIAAWFRARARGRQPRTWRPQRHGPGPAGVRRPLRHPSGCFSAHMHRLFLRVRALAAGRRSGSGRRLLRRPRVRGWMRRRGLGRAPPRPLAGRRAARAGAGAAATAAAPAAPAAPAAAGGAPPGALASAPAALGAGDSAWLLSRQDHLLGQARAGHARRCAAPRLPTPGPGVVGRVCGRQRRSQQLRAARIEQAGEGRRRGEQAALGRAVLQQRAPGRAGDQRAAVPDHPQRAPARRPRTGSHQADVTRARPLERPGNRVTVRCRPNRSRSCRCALLQHAAPPP